MNTIAKSLTINRKAILTLVMLLGIATAAPLLKQQFITGTIVNATLFIGAALLGAKEGLLLGLLPSTIALGTGLLSPALAPMVPFIILGNAILVLSFLYIGKINFWAGAITAALLKFGFLYFATSTVTGLLLNEKLAAPVAQTMSWPQLVTAVAGAVVAYTFIRFTRQESKNA